MRIIKDSKTALHLSIMILAPICAAAQESKKPVESVAAGRRSESFDNEPMWEGYRNRLLPQPIPRTRQDFGFRETHYAKGKEAGELGGWISRSARPAFSAKVVDLKTLDDRLTASGKFAVRKSVGNSGMLFGWFNSNSRGWRTPNSLAFRLDGNGTNYWVLFEYGTQGYLTGGGATFEGRYQTTQTKPFASDGTSHEWSLNYNPNGADGGGMIEFVLDGKTYSCPVPAEHKKDGAVFDRFGMFNQQIAGDGMEVYIDDLVLDGVPIEWLNDRTFDSVGNQMTLEDRVKRPFHHFGFSATGRSGGGKGEMGGVIWRDEAPAYYAAKTEPLTLDNELFASGKIAFRGAGSDSGVYLGWFDSNSKTNQVVPDHQQSQKNFLALLIEGPSRVGHYFRPAYRGSGGQGATMETGPVILPDSRIHRWTIHYRPDGANGRGQIEFSLDENKQVFDLSGEDKKRGAAFDRFGLFNIQTGGHFVEVYFDDLTYTATVGK